MGEIVELRHTVVCHRCPECDGTNFKLWTDGEIRCSHCEVTMEGLVVDTVGDESA